MMRSAIAPRKLIHYISRLYFPAAIENYLKRCLKMQIFPLYKLCWKLSLKRISTEHYQIYLQNAAKKCCAANNESPVQGIVFFTLPFVVVLSNIDNFGLSIIHTLLSIIGCALAIGCSPSS